MLLRVSLTLEPDARWDVIIGGLSPRGRPTPMTGALRALLPGGWPTTPACPDPEAFA